MLMVPLLVGKRVEPLYERVCGAAGWMAGRFRSCLREGERVGRLHDGAASGWERVGRRLDVVGRELDGWMVTLLVVGRLCDG